MRCRPRKSHERSARTRELESNSQVLRRFEFLQLGEEVPEVVGNILLGQAQWKQRSDQSPSPPREVTDRQDLHMAAAAVRGRGTDLPGASRFEEVGRQDRAFDCAARRRPVVAQALPYVADRPRIAFGDLGEVFTGLV